MLNDNRPSALRSGTLSETKQANPPLILSQYKSKPVCGWNAISAINRTVITAGYNAAMGSTGGAIGYAIMQTNGLLVPGIDYYDFIQAMAIGQAILSVIPCTSTEFLVKDQEYEFPNACKLFSSIALSLPVGFCDGVFAGLIGCAILDLLPQAEQYKFAVGAGALGNAIAAYCFLCMTCFSFGIICQDGIKDITRAKIRPN